MLKKMPEHYPTPVKNIKVFNTHGIEKLALTGSLG
jgi:hypothetical protein